MPSLKSANSTRQKIFELELELELNKSLAELRKVQARLVMKFFISSSNSSLVRIDFLERLELVYVEFKLNVSLKNTRFKLELERSSF